ncbi:MAG: methenyltetrahydromethanopterin cyclohydrolase [Thermoprotei archaeon ex4572_64]|nr:MAG: methenyltetrahydromethanopterin cyclohydrolase [Thermoprotei archaeon ex4572_64]
MSLSLNKRALKVIERILSHEREYGVKVHQIDGSTVIDAGVEIFGTYELGVEISKICLACLGDVKLSEIEICSISFPKIEVHTNYPIEACIISQMAGWNLKLSNFQANVSGPGKVLARKPKKIFEKFQYFEDSDEAVLVLETSKIPNSEVVDYLANTCKVLKSNLYIITTSPTSLSGITQICARIVEVAILKLLNMEFPLRNIIYSFGSCPIPYPVPNYLTSSGLANDFIIYAGKVTLMINHDDSDLKNLCSELVSSASSGYGVLLSEELERVGEEFLYKIDPKIFSPSQVQIYSLKTGKVYSAGKIDKNIITKILSKYYGVKA